MATIFRKTTKGQTEIETRALKLAPRFRSLLILVDGRRSDDELLRLMPQAGADALAALAEGGFIEAIGVTATPTPRSPGPPPAPAAAPAGPGFEQRRRDSVRALIDLVGPMAEALAVKMEGARDAAELKALIETAVQIVANTRGRAAAATYAQRFGSD